MNNPSLQNILWESEKENLKKAAIYSSIIVLTLALLGLFWVAMRGMIPPPDEKQYIVAGAIDFGDMSNGSKPVPSFEKPSETPSDKVKAVESTSEVAASKPTKTNVEEIITSNAESEIKAKPNTDSKEKIKRNDVVKPEKVKEKTTKPTTPKVANKESTKEKSSGGSDHGDSNEKGNKGVDAPVLDPKGLYSFGSGDYGLQGRRPLNLVSPSYSVQEEAKLTFEFIISPSGKVKYVKPPATNMIGLKKAGVDAIRKWKFDPVPSHKGDQKTKVTISFKLTK